MTCKDCIHYKACWRWATDAYGVYSQFPYKTTCVAFEPKSRYIELPCAVGDTVWFLNDRYHIELRKSAIYEAVVTRIVILKGFKGNTEVALVIQIRDSDGCTEIRGIKDFDKTVFLTKEEAEKALAKRSDT